MSRRVPTKQCTQNARYGKSRAFFRLHFVYTGAEKTTLLPPLGRWREKAAPSALAFKRRPDVVRATCLANSRFALGCPPSSLFSEFALFLVVSVFSPNFERRYRFDHASLATVRRRSLARQRQNTGKKKRITVFRSYLSRGRVLIDVFMLKKNRERIVLCLLLRVYSTETFFFFVFVKFV